MSRNIFGAFAPNTSNRDVQTPGPSPASPERLSGVNSMSSLRGKNSNVASSRHSVNQFSPHDLKQHHLYLHPRGQCLRLQLL